MADENKRVSYGRDAQEHPGPNLDRTIYGVVAWIGVGVLGVALAWLVTQQIWQGVGIVSALTVCCVLALSFRTRLPRVFALLFVLVALANAAGYRWNLWKNENAYWFDEIVHFCDSLIIGLVFMFWLYYARGRGKRPPRVWYYWITGAIFLIGIVWEIIEYTFDFHGPPLDTVSDVVLNTLGGAAGAWLGGLAVRYCHPDCLQVEDQKDASS